MAIQPRGAPPAPTRYKFMNEQVDVYNTPYSSASPQTSNTGQTEFVRRYTQPTPPTTPPAAVTSPAPVSTPPTAATPGAVSIPSPSANRPTLQGIDENTIREDTRKRMQAQIDAIDANFANLIAQENVQGQDRLGQTRAVNARSGLVGSDFGATQTSKTETFNDQQVQALQAQKQAQIQSVLQNIEDRATAEIERKKNEAKDKYAMEIGEYEDTQEELRSRQTEAKGNLDILAKNGFNLDTLDPQKKAKLFEEAGYDPGLGEIIYNALKPKPEQIDYKFEKLADGAGLFYGTDPVTGELKTQKVNVDLPPDWNMQIAPDGTVIGYDKNTGEARILSEQGQFADPYDQAYKEAQIQKILNDIANGQGDGLLSVEEANKLGVPYGTTKSQAVGIIPGSQEKIEKAETALDNTSLTLSLIQTLKNHTGLDGATGFFGSRINISGNSRDFVAKFDQLKALLSLDNIKYLKGTGAISDAEQQLLANAASSLRRDGDKRKLIEELNRLEQSLGTTQQKLQNIINVGNQSTIQEFEAQYGGSEGANPKAPTTTKAQSLSRSPDTKTLASAVLPKFPAGSVGGQCVTFLHKLADFPAIGDGKKQKFASVDKYGIPAGKLRENPQVGMILITGENKTYGHGAMINAISADGKYARLTESNFKGSERVTHDRVIALDSPKIYGAIIPKSLKNIG